jgi:alpha-galactosidase
LVIPICRDVERLCPEALVLNFTNPEARVLHAINHLTRVRAAGFCHGVFSAIGVILKYLNKKEEELDIVSAGMNHFYSILSVRDRATGEELLPKVTRIAVEDPAAPPLFRKFAAIFDVITYASDDHIGEYVPFGAEFQGIAWHYGQERRKVPLCDAPEPNALDEYASGKRPADDPLIVRGSAEVTVPVICDIELDRNGVHAAVNVLNTEGYIENLPRDVVVEVPGRANARGIEPLHVGRIPEAFAAFMGPQYMIHRLITEAYRTRSRKLLLQALLLDPVVNSTVEAEKLLDEMLALQSDFLPAFK